MKRIIAIILVALFVCACFVGCKKDDSKGDSSITGTYRVKTVDGDSVREAYRKQAEAYGMDLESFLSAMGMTESDLDKLMVMELYDGGTGKIYGSWADGEAQFTWSLNGETFSITNDKGETRSYSYKNGEIIYTESGTTLVLGK